MEFRVTTKSPEETLDLARRVGAWLPAKARVFLDAEMGAGKTVFAKGIYLGCGGEDVDQVVSPSYTLINLHRDAEVPIYHVDLYRLEDPRGVLGLEYEDFLYDNPGVTIVEWPRSAVELLDAEEILAVSIAPTATEDEREIVISCPGDYYSAVFEVLGS